MFSRLNGGLHHQKKNQPRIYVDLICPVTTKRESLDFVYDAKKQLNQKSEHYRRCEHRKEIPKRIKN